jgi:hypothetical protein
MGARKRFSMAKVAAMAHPPIDLGQSNVWYQIPIARPAGLNRSGPKERPQYR